MEYSPGVDLTLFSGDGRVFLAWLEVAKVGNSSAELKSNVSYVWYPFRTEVVQVLFWSQCLWCNIPPLNNNVIVHHNFSQRTSSYVNLADISKPHWQHLPLLLWLAIIVWLNQWDCSKQPWRHNGSILKRCFTVPLLINHCTSVFLEMEGLYPSAIHTNSQEIHL